MAKMIGRGKSYLVWLLGFIFTFLFGTGTGKAERPQMKYGIRPQPEIMKPLDNLIQPKYGVMVQPKYGVRPNPDLIAPDLIAQDLIAQDLEAQGFVTMKKKEVRNLIQCYLADKSSAAKKRVALRKLKTLKRMPIKYVGIRRNRTNKLVKMIVKKRKKLKSQGADPREISKLDVSLKRAQKSFSLYKKLEDELRAEAARRKQLKSAPKVSPKISPKN